MVVTPRASFFHDLALHPPRRPAVSAAVTEALATLREVVLMPFDVGTVIPETRAEDHVVVFVHGFMATAGVFRPMRRHLERHAGVRTASFTHLPGRGVDAIARDLKAVVDRIDRRASVHLVGHSLGGLVARWYVQELGGHERIAQTISLGSPFGGTDVAHSLPVLVGAELVRHSRLLARLRERAHHHDVHHTSIVGDADDMVVPWQSGIFPTGDVLARPGLGHNGLLYDEEVLEHVLHRLKNAQLRSSRP